MAGKTDTHVTIVPTFTVPDGKLPEFKAGFPQFFECVKQGTKECLYYGFAVHENTVVCREGYESAEGALAHLSDVEAPLAAALAIVGSGVKLSIMGPKAELDKLREPMAHLGPCFWELDSGSMWFGSSDFEADTHVTIVPYFTVPEGKMSEFQAGFQSFYECVKKGTKECLYYGFTVCENQVYCREGYKSAEGAFAHLEDVKESLGAAMAIVGPGGLDLSIMGPKPELDKMRGPLAGLGPKFFETDEGGMWMGGKQ